MDDDLATDGPLPVKDENNECPVAGAWRPVFCSIVRALASSDYRLIGEINSVEPVSEDQADHIRGNVAAYGATLVELSEETWNSSIALWMGNYWDIIVDLWTAKKAVATSPCTLACTRRRRASGSRSGWSTCPNPPPTN
ncbi:DUF7668 domain-containing protein [Nocardia sp. NPDC003979]